MTVSIPVDFLRAIPKTDLHVHLDGSLRLETLIELAKTARIDLPSHEPEGLRELVFKEAYSSLPEYLKGFSYTVAVLQTAENLERVAYELAEDNLAEGVRYVEVRFAPQLHLQAELPIGEVLAAVCRGMDALKNRHNVSDAVRRGSDLPFEYGIIVCALRRFAPIMSPYYEGLFKVLPSAPCKEVFATASLELARSAVEMKRQKAMPIIGFDLAGEESGYPAGDHRAAFEHAHRNFLRKTVHAGEAYGPESIFHAITECHANRIGHGTFLFHPELIYNEDVDEKEAYVENLAQYIASERIAIEVCLTSNLQTTPSIASVAQHPVSKMIGRKLSVSICTDNRLVSNTSVTRELRTLVEGVPITRWQLRNLIVAGFKGSFFPGTYTEKRAYVRKAIDLYEAYEKEFLCSKKDDT